MIAALARLQLVTERLRSYTIRPLGCSAVDLAGAEPRAVLWVRSQDWAWVLQHAATVWGALPQPDDGSGLPCVVLDGVTVAPWAPDDEAIHVALLPRVAGVQ